MAELPARVLFRAVRPALSAQSSLVTCGEEQFYIVWPWLLLLGIRLTKERRALQLRVRLGGVILLLACASAAEMAILYQAGLRSDTRLRWHGHESVRPAVRGSLRVYMAKPIVTATVGRHAAWLLDAVGCVGLAGIAVMIFTTSEYSPFIYHGGLVLASVFSVMTIAALTHPASQLGRVLGSGPLRWIGVRSYGLYLWHEPIIALTTPNANLGVQPLRAALQVAGAVVLAALSWRYVENPIRHHALHRLWRTAKSSARRARSLALTLAPISAIVAFAILGISAR